MSKNVLEQIREELSVLTFARVSHIVLKDEHKSTYDTTINKEDTYQYYYGFAKVEKSAKEQGTVWFKNATHLTRGGGFFFGCVSHAPGYTKVSDIPKRGDTVVGKIVQSKKGASFEWWTHHATPFVNFRAFLHNPKKLSNQPRAFSMLKLVHSRKQTTDDLYIMAQVLLKQDVAILVSQLLEERERVRHPWLKDASGYQRKRGFDLEYHVVEIAYFLSLFVKQPDIYKKFMAEMEKHKTEIVEWPTAKLSEYSLERLEKNIEYAARVKKEET